jgi:hypothetical protein
MRELLGKQASLPRRGFVNVSLAERCPLVRAYVGRNVRLWPLIKCTVDKYRWHTLLAVIRTYGVFKRVLLVGKSAAICAVGLNVQIKKYPPLNAEPAQHTGAYSVERCKRFGG